MHGDAIEVDHRRISLKLLDSSSVAENGPWIRMPACHRFSAGLTTSPAIEVGGSANVQVAQNESQPPTNEPGTTVFTLNVATPQASSDFQARWIRAVRSVGGGPAAVTVILTVLYNQ